MNITLESLKIARTNGILKARCLKVDPFTFYPSHKVLLDTGQSSMEQIIPDKKDWVDPAYRLPLFVPCDKSGNRQARWQELERKIKEDLMTMLSRTHQ